MKNDGLKELLLMRKKSQKLLEDFKSFRREVLERLHITWNPGVFSLAGNATVASPSSALVGTENAINELNQRIGRNIQDEGWSDFSISSAMRGMEEEEGLLKEK